MAYFFIRTSTEFAKMRTVDGIREMISENPLVSQRNEPMLDDT
jgi:hypothetical protein